MDIKNRVKILYVLNNPFNYGGTEGVVLNYYNHINKEKFCIEFAVCATENEFRNSQLTQELILKGVKIFRVTPIKENIYNNYKDFKSILSNEYDIVHTHTDAIGARILRIAKKCGIKVRIAHSHNTNFPVEGDSLKNKIKLVYLKICRDNICKYATDYMACSKEAAKWLFKNNFNDAYILNNAIDSEQYAFDAEKRTSARNELNVTNELLIGNVGRLAYQKNQANLIRIFSQAAKINSNIKLLIIGEGPLKDKLIQTAVENDVNDKVIFYGTSDDIPSLLSAMDLYVLPSWFEGLSLSLVEAQANGLHCIINDSKKISKDSDITGQVERIPVDDENAWIAAILNCNHKRYTDSINRIKKAGFDINIEAKKLEKYYISKLLQHKSTNNVGIQQGEEKDL